MKVIFLAHISSISVLIPLIIGAIQWKNLSKKFKLVFYVLACAALSDIISLFCIRNGINNWPIVNAFFIFQFLLFYLFFLSDYPKHFFLNLLFSGFLLYSILNYLFLETPVKFNEYTSYTGALFMMVLALAVLLRLLRDLPAERVKDLPMLWIAFAVLVYFGGTLFPFLFNNYLIANLPSKHKVIWIVHNMLNVMKNVFLAIALWKHYRQSISPG